MQTTFGVIQGGAEDADGREEERRSGGPDLHRLLRVCLFHREETAPPSGTFGKTTEGTEIIEGELGPAWLLDCVVGRWS